MKRSDTSRITAFLVVVGLVLAGLGYRLFVLTEVRHLSYVRIAQAQTEHLAAVFSRGTISFSDRDGSLVAAAANKKFPVLSVDTARISVADRAAVAERLAGATGIDADVILGVLDTDAAVTRTFSRHLTNEQAAAVQALSIPGATIAYEMDRFYPNGSLAADVLGFLGYDGQGSRSGQYGVEAYYDQDLFGRITSSGGFGVANLLSRFLGTSDSEKQQVNQPKGVVLTIDRTVQAFTEDQLDAAIEKWDAAGGTVIVEDPRTGAILAMADRPTFDPNAYAESKQSLFLNSSVQEVFEPGSSFKPVTMAAGLDTNAITPDTTYDDTGSVTIAGHVIRNYDGLAHGINTMTQVLEHSLNTGTMFVEKLIGNDTFLSYVVNMGFGQRTGIDLPGEVGGNIANLYSGRDINYLTASFGQGVAVTPLQLVNAYATIANGGKLMRPYVVRDVVAEDGTETVTQPQVLGTPIKSSTAVKLQQMLVSVVDKGFDAARITGYDVAGKTGTAQIPDDQGGYADGQYIHSFLGFAPGYDARFVILLKLDRPQGTTYASTSLSPVFKNIAAFLLNYYAIPPTR